MEELIKEIIRQPSTTEYLTQKLSKACNIDELQKRVKDLKARRTTLLKKQTKFEQEQNELDPSDKFYDHKYDRISRGLEEKYEQNNELNMALSQTELSIKIIQKGFFVDFGFCLYVAGCRFYGVCLSGVFAFTAYGLVGAGLHS